MTTPSRILLLLATGIGAIYSLIRVEHGYQVLFHTGWVGPEQPPSFSEILFVPLAAILTLIFLVLGMSIVYRCYFRKP